jgi:hypothetical protein
MEKNRPLRAAVIIDRRSARRRESRKLREE